MHSDGRGPRDAQDGCDAQDKYHACDVDEARVARPEGGPAAGAGDPSPAVMECGICWYAYDPARGDAVWQIAPGVPFAQLPDRWSCPECDAPRHKFLRVER
jgi:rubredoxin